MKMPSATPSTAISAAGPPRKPVCWNCSRRWTASRTRCATGGAGCDRRRRRASLWFLPARTELVPQPVGVVGVIVPWNYPAVPGRGADRRCTGCRQPRHGQDERARAGLLGTVRSPGGCAFPGRRDLRGQRWRRRGARVHGDALRPPAVYRFDGRRPARDARGSGEPDPGDPGAGRQVAGHHRPGGALRRTRSSASCMASASMPARPASHPTTCCCRASGRTISLPRLDGYSRACIRTMPAVASTPAWSTTRTTSAWCSGGMRRSAREPRRMH